MSTPTLIFAGWLLFFVLVFAAMIAVHFSYDRDARRRINAHLAEDRELKAWVDLWEDTFAAPAGKPRGVA